MIHIQLRNFHDSEQTAHNDRQKSAVDDPKCIQPFFCLAGAKDLKMMHVLIFVHFTLKILLCRQ